MDAPHELLAMPAIVATLMAVLAKRHGEVPALLYVMGIARGWTIADTAGQQLHRSGHGVPPLR